MSVQIQNSTQLLQLGFQAFSTGRFSEAAAQAERVLQVDPQSQHGRLLRALSLAALGRHGDALPLFQTVAEREPGVAEHWINLGAVQRPLGDLAAAAQSWRRAEALGAQHPEFLADLTALLIDLGDLAGAQSRIERLLRFRPEPPLARLLQARCAIEGGEVIAAREFMLAAEPRLPDDPLTHSQAGALWLQIGDAERAQRWLDRAFAGAPSHPDVRARCALLLERTNRLDQAATLLSEHAGPDSYDLQQARAKLLVRRGQGAEAIAAYRALIEATPSRAQQHGFWFELGKLHDAEGDAEAAMQAFERAHAGKVEQIAHSHPQYLREDDDLLKLLRYPSDPGDAAGWRVPVTQQQPSPIFVVGFPRSGTTLLEQILDSHPALQAMDEQPFLQRVIDRVLKGGVAYPERMAELSPDRIDELRAGYYADVARVVELQPGQRLVDKNPLNLARLPMIRRLFPDAPVILALRHPLDVVLSCHMQAFRAPAFAMLCRDLPRTADSYARMMQAFLDERERLPGPLLEWRYEDLIADYRGRVEVLLSVLGLDWVPALDDIAAQARARGFISTPSYHQVIEPINARAVGRWQRYRRWLQAVVPTVEPYVRRWGYALD